jgi:hypothetical protein
MADQLTISDTTYAGTVEAEYMITQATFSLDTVSKGVAYVKDGIKKQHNIPKIDVANPLQARVPTPTASGAFTVTGVVLAPKDTMAYTEFNPRDWETHFYAEKLSQTLLARELPVTAENVMMQLFLNRCFEQVENGIHMGSVSYTATAGTAGNGQIKFWDGIIRQAIVDGNFLAVGSPSTITSANILGKMDAAIALLPKAILSDGNRYTKVKFCVSVVDYQLFELATQGLTFKGQDIINPAIAKYRGYQVIPLAGLPASTFYLTKAYPDLDSNIWIGTNSMEDLNLQLSKLQANSELFFLKGLFKFDVKIAKMNEFVMHTPLVASAFTA